jgi:hypothetical protein
MAAKRTAAPRSSGNFLRTLRVSLLAYALVIVAALAWFAKARSTDWDDTLYMAVYPVNGDGSVATATYLSTLHAAAFASVETFVAREAARYGIALAEPLAVELGAVVAQAPPTPPDSRNPLAIIAWSLRLRWFAWRVEQAQTLPAPDVRMFVVYHDPQTHERLAHSLGLEKGLIGVVNAYADAKLASRNGVVIAHELLHTLGATDKYDPATSLPLYPDGYADPQREPRYPQVAAEIMGGRIALAPDAADMPASLEKCVVGERTATEIRWRR